MEEAWLFKVWKASLGQVTRLSALPFVVLWWQQLGAALPHQHLHPATIHCPTVLHPSGKEHPSTSATRRVDIDWEYPGREDRGGRPEDRDNFVLLLRELRQAINGRGQPLLLTLAVAAASGGWGGAGPLAYLAGWPYACSKCSAGTLWRRVLQRGVGTATAATTHWADVVQVACRAACQPQKGPAHAGGHTAVLGCAGGAQGNKRVACYVASRALQVTTCPPSTLKLTVYIS